MGRDKRKKVPKHSRGGQELDEDDLAVARPVEIGEEGLLDIRLFNLIFWEKFN